ncbi:MAG TPA: bifunctional precorrin-2 dehydrogenase/sirohydrochlorin ferrochelatase [Candidatus Margulisiibacteriota bacterium]|nr:bifunctional precorrin-2 dehydrogenase/sirohydrochlorin ferrochelatase [Candidatus Margulisiibacteriota bacterium]
MNYYPIFLRVAGRSCLVVGGGRVAEQKVESLLSAGARVTVLSPRLTPRLQALAVANRITHVERTYTEGDLAGYLLACAATDDNGLHARIAAEAETAGVLLNVVDRPQLCHFITPSVVERGDLMIATSTNGASPAMAKRIRRELEESFGPEYELALTLLRRVRESLHPGACSRTERLRIFNALVDSPLLDYLRHGRQHDIDALLASTIGAGVSLASLGIELPPARRKAIGDTLDPGYGGD